jgi:PAS domain S-box-containing protein
MIDLLRTKALSRYFHHSGQFYYILTDLQGNCYYINPLFLKQQGYADTGTEGVPFTALIVAGDFQLYQSTINHCLEHPGMAYTADLHHPHPDGSTVAVRWEFVVLLNENNEGDTLQCVGTPLKDIQRHPGDIPISDNERYKAYELSSQGIWRLDLETPAPADWPLSKLVEHCRKHAYMTDCNDMMAHMYGLKSRDEMIGMRLESLMNMDDPHQLEYFQNFIRNGFRIENAETQEHDVNGRRLYFLNNMTGIIEGGLLKRVWGTQQDITEKKKAEEQLMRSELFYRNLIGDSLDGILLTDANGLITFASSSVEKILGYRPEDLVQTRAFDYVHPDDQLSALSAFQDEVRMEPLTKFIDIRLRTKYGEWIYCNVRGHNMLYNPYVGRMVVYFQDDTQRKRTETALRESERQHLLQARLLSNVTDVITTADKNFVLTSWNKVAEELSGIPAEEAIGKLYRDVLPLDYSPYTKEQVAEEVFTTGVWKGEISFTNRRGEKKYLLHTISAFSDDRGEISGLLGVGKDITEKKLAEEQLVKSELFYRSLITHSLDGIVLTDYNGTISFSGPSVERLIGLAPEEVIGRNMFEFIHPDDRDLTREAFELEINEGIRVDYLLIRVKNAEGKWFWCSGRGHKLALDNGTMAMVINFADDSARKKAEDRLRESEELIRHLLDNMKTGVVMQDVMSETLICNKAAYELMGVTEAQLLGHESFDPRWNVIHEDGTDFPTHTHPPAIAIQTKQAVRDVIMGVYRPAFNDRVWLLVNAEPILDDNKEILHVICSFTDITEQKKLSTALVGQEIQKQRLLTQATIDAQEKERREIGKELHDNISQHLTTTRLYLEVAQEKAVKQEVRDMISHAYKELNDIINEIRKLSQSLVPPTLGDIGLVESIQDLCEALERTHKIEIDFNHRSFTEQVMAENMKLMLFRVIQEQINNIMRHSGADTITLFLQSDAEQVGLTINDNGRGFDTITESKRGLGLTNMNNRVSLFNGKLEIWSAQGKGCTLMVTVPLS